MTGTGENAVDVHASGSIVLASWLLFALAPLTAQTERPGSWLDRPLNNWNQPGLPVPKAQTGANSTAEVIKRCRLTPSRETPAERAVSAAGWITYVYFEQKLVRDDVEIVAAMQDADGMCRPSQYNLFVFVAGRFAGQLAPASMTSRLDGSSGSVRLPLPNITAEFSRYTSDDPLCCPSAHVTVR